jgi:putative Mg2+ transporter-C (MgtC) family protein
MLPDWELVSRLLIAALLGAFVGFEREHLHKPAGLRTHMLVSTGACLFMIVSAFGFRDILGTEHVTLDPSRVAAQVVSGIGFLGAGAILLRGKFIQGITTAASIWTVAAVGLATGGGLYIEAIAATVIILIILVVVGRFEQRVIKPKSKKHLHRR